MLMRPALTLDDAKKFLDAGENEARRMKLEVVIAVLDNGARLIALHRMDGARPGNPDIAIRKASTSALTCRPSSVWERWIEGPHKAYATFGLLASGGGVPILIDGYCVGAIGVSGAKAEEDERIAAAAVRQVLPNAKTAREGEEDVPC
jgi:glc operon protein GlcG